MLGLIDWSFDGFVRSSENVPGKIYITLQAFFDMNAFIVLLMCVCVGGVHTAAAEQSIQFMPVTGL